MIVDCHVHVAATTPGRGSMSRRLLHSTAFRFMFARHGISIHSPRLDDQIEALLSRTLDQTHRLDAAVILAFDAVYRHDGTRDAERTHLFVENDYVIDLCRRHRKMRFGASVHPYRPNAVAELERCVAAGAVLLKWLPIVQDFDPSDERCLPFYEALAHHRLPLLCHTGGEQSLPNLNKRVADPALLEPALKRGVTVIMAHCGSQSQPFEHDFTGTFVRLAREYEHCYGDTAALCLPTRWCALKLYNDPSVRRKLIHGSDWPIIPLPPPKLGLVESTRLLRDRNWLQRDVKIKQALGFDSAYWFRAAQVLRLPESTTPST